MIVYAGLIFSFFLFYTRYQRCIQVGCVFCKKSVVLCTEMNE